MNASALARSWAALYTRGISPAAREERVAELESDLWEHRAARGGGLGTEAAILSRCLRGVPADIAWRSSRRTRRPLTARRVVHGAGWAVFALAAALLLAFTGAAAAPLVGVGPHPDWDPADVTLWERRGAALFLALTYGLALLRWRPRVGAVLVAAVACTAAVCFWWALVLFGPAAAVLTIGAAAIARRRSPT